MYLSPAERRRLAHLAALTGRSQAQIIREAIHAYAPAEEVDRSFALIAVSDGPEGSVADVDEAQLLEGFGE